MIRSPWQNQNASRWLSFAVSQIEKKKQSQQQQQQEQCAVAAAASSTANSQCIQPMNQKCYGL